MIIVRFLFFEMILQNMFYLSAQQDNKCDDLCLCDTGIECFGEITQDNPENQTECNNSTSFGVLINLGCKVELVESQAFATTPPPSSRTTAPSQKICEADSSLEKLLDQGCSIQLIKDQGPSNSSTRTTATPKKFCNSESFEDIVATGCLITLRPANSENCWSCAEPVRVDDWTHAAGMKKVHCAGEGSTSTVHGQKCKANKFGMSTCMWGGEGFSFCDVEFLFFRGGPSSGTRQLGQWVDWDLCSLCVKVNTSRPLTAHGYVCDGECVNTWNNREIEAPRCRVQNRRPADPEYDYCTTCTTNCAKVEVDKRPGNKVKPFQWGQFNLKTNTSASASTSTTGTSTTSRSSV